MPVVGKVDADVELGATFEVVVLVEVELEVVEVVEVGTAATVTLGLV